MENSEVKIFADVLSMKDKTVVEAFAPDFWPITIQREMSLFKGAIGLTPGLAARPSTDFLFRLLTPYRSHRAFLRAIAEEEFDNLENLLLGNSISRDRTLQDLSKRLGLSMEFLESLKGVGNSKELCPDALRIFRIVEGLPFVFFRALMSHKVNCPTCGANMLSDEGSWWQAQAVKWNRPEYMFAERLLESVVGAFTAYSIFFHSNETRTFDLEIGSMASKTRHPIGNWLHEVMKRLGSKDYFELANHLPLNGADPITQARLKKWSAGVDLMPLKVSERILSCIPRNKLLSNQLLVARSFAFVEDFLLSATAVEMTPSEKRMVRNIVSDRVESLAQKMRLLMRSILARDQG
jgi:hypothetical protein